MGANFIKGRVAEITEKENGNLVLRYEDIENGRIAETEHDLVVLAVGVRPMPTRVVCSPRGAGVGRLLLRG